MSVIATKQAIGAVLVHYSKNGSAFTAMPNTLTHEVDDVLAFQFKGTVPLGYSQTILANVASEGRDWAGSAGSVSPTKLAVVTSAARTYGKNVNGYGQNYVVTAEQDLDSGQ